ncbi:DNA recombination protein RmuC [Persicirhabdus sediminis]|uniref:DNA recombination protein RmuC n=1 Tax=Persicirhabdus sediminis TaxID=454144 RepID=A0A8J7SKS1_9BACT|nr:DNA recombination protein RmuC [Persicirhabdus sediminis]MBK1792284.1 DNA recombination protein RmuC [Persicirhabdus sediminis]
MDNIFNIIALVFGAILGGSIMWGIYSPRIKAAEMIGDERLDSETARARDLDQRLKLSNDELQELRAKEQDLMNSKTELETQLREVIRSAEEKQALLDSAEARFSDAFKALSADALRSSQEQFLQLAGKTLQNQQQQAVGELDQRRVAMEQMVKPVAESLNKVCGQISQLEKSREGAYAAIKEQVQYMAQTQRGLAQETNKLVSALRQPTGRGQWGEMQLRRVVEMAGMQEYCDFETQTSTTDEDGKRLRPDMIVRLPAGQQIIVDSKAPMDAYLSAVEAEDDGQREAELIRHARQVNTHINQLGSKNYQEQFEQTPEFVVLFLPSEAFFSAALAQDPSLIEKGVDQGVILATPTTLIALLRAAAYGWRQEALTENAKEISSVGQELYKRLSAFGGHVQKLGRSLNSAVGDYNKAVGSLESRVYSSARRFEVLGAAAESQSLPEASPIETLPRTLKSEYMQSDAALMPPEGGDFAITPEEIEASSSVDFDSFSADDLESGIEGFTALPADQEAQPEEELETAN